MQALGMAVLATVLIWGSMFLMSKVQTNEPVVTRPWNTLPKNEKIANVVAVSVMSVFILAILWFMYQYVIPYMD